MSSLEPFSSAIVTMLPSLSMFSAPIASVKNELSLRMAILTLASVERRASAEVTLALACLFLSLFFSNLLMLALACAASEVSMKESRCSAGALNLSGSAFLWRALHDIDH
jgi:hypothetical protein